MSSSRVRILMMRHATFYTPVIAAISGGFLKEEGLDVEYLVRSPDQNPLEMLQKGEVEISQSAVSSSWMRIEKGLQNLPGSFCPDQPTRWFLDL